LIQKYFNLLALDTTHFDLLVLEREPKNSIPRITRLDAFSF
jgi:hypothetical protein